MKASIVCVLLGALAVPVLGGCNADAPMEASSMTAAPAPPSRQSKLTLALVIDQLSLWEAVERLPALPPGGGLSRLALEASTAVELRYGYVQTSTAMGHSSLFTGLAPHDSGITSNEILDDSGKPFAIVSDRTTRLVSARGRLDRPGASLAALTPGRETLADALRRQRPDVTIACLSMKDRGAVFACGRAPDIALWFDVREDAFVTSTAFAEHFPPALSAFGTTGVGTRYRADQWKPKDPEWLAARVTSPEIDRGQGNFEQLGTRFPHDFSASGNPARAMLASPMADELLTDLALATLDSLPPEKDAFLAISFSAHDYILHMFGAGAPESWDELLRLDQQVARLYDRLDALYGPSRYSIVLAADHGGPPAPEGDPGTWCNGGGQDYFERPCRHARRIYEAEITEKARAVARETLGAGDWVLGTSEPFVVLTKSARELPNQKLDRLLAALRSAISAMPGVADVFDTRGSDARPCPPESDDSRDALVCRSLSGDRNGSLLVVPAHGAFFDSGYVEGDGCNHGTPFLFDRTVPLFVRPPRSVGQPRRSSLPVFDPATRVDPRAYVVTLADLLSVDPPALGNDGRARAPSAP